jgi:phage FluMu protein Com
MTNFVRLMFNSSSQMYIAGVTVPHKVLLDIPCMVVYSCKKCGELNYLTPHAFWNIADFDAKCEKCETINTITLEEGELKKWV